MQTIIGPLPILTYVNDLSNARNVSDPIMFVDDTNLLLEIFFHLMSKELHKISEQFKANKVSLNIKKHNIILS